MSRVLILGAHGQLAQNTTRMLLRSSDASLALYPRNASRLTNADPERARIIDGDVLDFPRLIRAMNDQEVVYANLAGEMERQAETIVRQSLGVSRA